MSTDLLIPMSDGRVKYFTIEKFSHHFVVSTHTPRGHDIIMKFASNYVQMGLVKVGRIYRRMPVRVFAARCAKKREIRFHHGQWNEFQAYLTGLGLTENTYDLKVYGFYEASAVSMAISEGWSARDYQIPIIEYLNSPEPSPIKLLEIQTGKGKAHPDDEPIKTDRGWTVAGSLKPGDMIVDDMGLPVEVTAVYPQGEQPIYGITTTDGRFARSTLDHLWSVVIQSKTGNLEEHTLSLRELMIFQSNPEYRVLLPLPEPIVGKIENVPFDAWCLGAIVSSGYLHTENKQKTIRVILQNNFTINKLEKELEPLGYTFTPEGRHVFTISSKHGDFEDTELFQLFVGSGAAERRNKRAYIPKIYFEASVGIRQAFISGVMDASGFVDKATRLVMTTTDEIFSEDFVYMVRSLGDKVFTTKKGPKRISHVVHTLNTETYFECPDNRSKAKNQNITIATRFVDVAKISYVGNSPCTCLSIDNEDGLYVINDFILTHNTYSASEAIVKNGKRFIIFLKPQFIEKWVSDLKKLMGFEKEDIAVVQGSASMMALIAEAASGEIPYKAIIVSNRTFQNWLSAYEEEGDALLDKGYDCHPHQLMQILKVGLRLIDEVHMDFHLNFKIDLYTHVEKSISLSATLISDDKFISSMQLTAYPKYLRYAGMEYDRYVDSVAYLYKLAPGVRVRTTEDGKSYSHHAFEKSLYKHTGLMKTFLAMVEQLTRKYFTQRAGVVKGDRCLIYVSSIQFATTVVEYLTKKFPEYDIRRYVEDDPYENLMEAEISVSTVGSAGTGHDIPDLVTVILTTAISSSSSNIQGFGRLRNLTGKQMMFIYLSCMDIEKHMNYHDKKNLMLTWMAKSKEIIEHREALG